MRRPRLIVLQPTPYCNIQCTYCYLGNRDDRRLMSNAVIEAIREKIFANLDADASPTVVWHAGEPTTAPISWYEHAYERLRDVTPSGTSFAMQSNGIAIDEKWIELFRRTNTSVSLSIDGPQHFHDLRRRTRNNKPTWQLAVGALRRLQNAGFEPNVICVLHPDGLTRPDAYYEFCRDHSITQISFSIDELEGANRASSFSARDYKRDVTQFLASILEQAYAEGYPLHVREVERIAAVLTGSAVSNNEQIEPWDTIVVGADGSVSTFSPEFMEVRSSEYRNFVFGNILDGNLWDFDATLLLKHTAQAIVSGVDACRSGCSYFAVCGGGAPVNKMTENGRLESAETVFCRLSVQSAADALAVFIKRRGGRPHSVAYPNAEIAQIQFTTGDIQA
jgi:uncharacterized protein